MKLSEETKKHLKSGADIIVSVSGGKDSTACCLKLFELGYSKDDFKRVFMDTGWESPVTYKYLDELENSIGKITRIKADIDISKYDQDIQDFILNEEALLGRESPFIRQLFYTYCWPSSIRKFCTRDLKLIPFSKYLEKQDNDCIVIVGVRRQESIKRQNVLEWEWNDRNNAYTWRILYNWSEKDVIDIHTRFNLIPNQLYLKNHSRVGCYPCIYAKKNEIQKINKDRIELISRVEKKLGEFNYKRNKGKNNKIEDALLKRKNESGFFFDPMFRKSIYKDHIKYVIEWSKTVYGGKQYALFDLEEPSCFKWGLCNFTGGEQ